MVQIEIDEDAWQFELDRMSPWTTDPAKVEAHLDAAPLGKRHEAELTRQEWRAEMAAFATSARAA